MIEIDGSEKEAGGQIVRTAVGLSALTGKPCHISNIRAGRPKPGLMAQHLTGVHAVAKLCNASVKGAELFSTELIFEPHNIKSGKFNFDIQTAGSISLVIQSLLTPAIASRKPLSFEIKGGTDVAWSPSVLYFQNILSHWLQKMGVEIKTEIVKYGFYPSGGGHVRVEISPTKCLHPLNITERDKPKTISIISIASESLRSARVAERQLETAKNIITSLPNFSGEAIRSETHYVPTLSPGNSIQLCAEFENCRLGAGAIGERDKRAEQVGKEAAELLKKQMDSNACVDRWSADQLLPFLAIAAYHNEPLSGKGELFAKGNYSEISVAEITNHCLTNICTIEKFLPVKFDVIGEKGKPGIIKCHKI